MELLDLSHQALVNILALRVQTIDSLFDLIWDTLHLVESVLDLLMDLLVDLVLRILVHELDPLDETGVLRDDLTSRLASELLELCFVLDELVRLIGSLTEVLLHLLHHLGHIVRLLQVDIVHVLHDVIDELLALVDQGVVQVVALDEEHAHANLVRGLSLNLRNRVLVLLNALDVLGLVALFSIAESLDFLLLLHQEQVLVVDVDRLSGDLKVVQKDLSDLLLGIHNNLVILTDLPEMSLVRICDLSVSAWNVIDCLHHGHDDLDELILHCIEVLVELNLVRLLIDLELQCKESVLEFVIRAVLS